MFSVAPVVTGSEHYLRGFVRESEKLGPDTRLGSIAIVPEK